MSTVSQQPIIQALQEYYLPEKKGKQLLKSAIKYVLYLYVLMLKKICDTHRYCSKMTSTLFMTYYGYI